MNFYNYFDKIINILLECFNLLSNIYFFGNLKLKKKLKKNKKLKRNNDKCFIICNGPSLNDIDIFKIKNADIITVNFFYKKEEFFQNFESNFHIAIDTEFFRKEKYIEYLNEILEKKKKINLIIKSSELEKFENHKDRVFGVYSKLIQYGKKLNFDLTKNMTATINVSIMALQLALYLGYKEIYLLGIDFSDYREKNMSKHFYGNETYDKDELLKGDELRWFSLAYKHHYAIQKWALKNGVKIFNAAPEEKSFLDAYPFIEYEDIVQFFEERRKIWK